MNANESETKENDICVEDKIWTSISAPGHNKSKWILKSALTITALFWESFKTNIIVEYNLGGFRRKETLSNPWKKNWP